MSLVCQMLLLLRYISGYVGFHWKTQFLLGNISIYPAWAIQSFVTWKREKIRAAPQLRMSHPRLRFDYLLEQQKRGPLVFQRPRPVARREFRVIQSFPNERLTSCRNSMTNRWKTGRRFISKQQRQQLSHAVHTVVRRQKTNRDTLTPVKARKWTSGQRQLERNLMLLCISSCICWWTFYFLPASHRLLLLNYSCCSVEFMLLRE